IYRKLLRNLEEELIVNTNNNDYQGNLAAIANLYVKGYEIDWEILHQDEPKQSAILPGYPFAKTRYWFNSYPQTDNQRDTLNIKLNSDELPAFINNENEQESLQVINFTIDE